MIEVYDLSGSKVDVLVDSYYTPGFYQHIWNPSNFVNGIYFIRYIFQGSDFTQKVTLLK